MLGRGMAWGDNAKQRNSIVKSDNAKQRNSIVKSGEGETETRYAAAKRRTNCSAEDKQGEAW